MSTNNKLSTSIELEKKVFSGIKIIMQQRRGRGRPKKEKESNPNEQKEQEFDQKNEIIPSSGVRIILNTEGRQTRRSRQQQQQQKQEITELETAHSAEPIPNNQEQNVNDFQEALDFKKNADGTIQFLMQTQPKKKSKAPKSQWIPEEQAQKCPHLLSQLLIKKIKQNQIQ